MAPGPPRPRPYLEERRDVGPLQRFLQAEGEEHFGLCVPEEEALLICRTAQVLGARGPPGPSAAAPDAPLTAPGSGGPQAPPPGRRVSTSEATNSHGSWHPLRTPHLHYWGAFTSPPTPQADKPKAIVPACACSDHDGPRDVRLDQLMIS